MKKHLVDQKQPLAYAVFGCMVKIAVRLHFKTVEAAGQENIPQDGSFLLVSNHISRWDGLILQQLINRPANWMVSPDELVGLQGLILRSMGAFPASPCYDLVGFAMSQATKGHGMVVFPEGNIFQDGITHPFKNGAARLALNCTAAGIALKVIPAAVSYSDEEGVRIAISEAVDIGPYLTQYANECNMSIRCLSARLHREVCHLRQMLGEPGDIFTGRPLKLWVPRTAKAVLSSNKLRAEDHEENKPGLAARLVEASHSIS